MRQISDGSGKVDLSLPDGQRVFHVHTWRCGHAALCPDRDYVQKAVHLGAREIWFTDHAPFPGDLFGGRMLVRQLPEYLKSMRALAEEFRGVIRVIPGLETEYLPGMDEWYGELKDAGLVLLLGQHMYACPDGTMNFRLPEVRRRAEEADGIADALAAGIASGHFFAAAHPDRAFRHRPVWTKEEDRLSRIILKAAREARIPVEDNLACHRSGQFRPEFWQMAGEYGARTVCGLDAHSPEEVVRWTGTEYSERKKETI